MKFTDEELSRVLSAHEAGTLQPLGYGVSGNGKACCVMQTARGGAIPLHGSRPLLYSWAGASEFDVVVAALFDRQYDPEWSSDQLVIWLESLGVA